MEASGRILGVPGGIGDWHLARKVRFPGTGARRPAGRSAARSSGLRRGHRVAQRGRYRRDAQRERTRERRRGVRRSSLRVPRAERPGGPLVARHAGVNRSISRSAILLDPANVTFNLQIAARRAVRRERPATRLHGPARAPRVARRSPVGRRARGAACVSRRARVTDSKPPAHEGGCHCGRVRFRVYDDLSQHHGVQLLHLRQEGLLAPHRPAESVRTPLGRARSLDVSVQHGRGPAPLLPHVRRSTVSTSRGRTPRRSTSTCAVSKASTWPRSGVIPFDGRRTGSTRSPTVRRCRARTLRCG